MEMNFWQKAEIFAKILGLILVPLVLTFITQLYTDSKNQREILQRKGELDLKYVELATEILKMDSKGDEENKALRRWSKDVLNYYSNISFKKYSLEELNQYKLPLDIKDCTTLGCKYLKEFLATKVIEKSREGEDYLDHFLVIDCIPGHYSKESEHCKKHIILGRSELNKKLKIKSYSFLTSNRKGNQYDFSAKVVMRFDDIGITEFSPIDAYFKFEPTTKGLKISEISFYGE